MTSPSAITEHLHTPRTSTSQRSREDLPTQTEQDPNSKHTQASGSPGARREPWRAAAKIHDCAAATATNGDRRSSC